MQFQEDESFLCKFRITLDKIKKHNTPESIVSNLYGHFDKDLPFLITQETGKNGSQHYHGVVYSEHPEFISQTLKNSVQQRGYSSNMYELENNRTPEYYFGYILKENPPNILLQNKKYSDKICLWKKYYAQQNVKTSDDCLKYVQENYGSKEYDETELIQCIVDYYKDTKKVYDKYIILRRAFHMCRLALFEDIEKKDIVSSLDKIIDG